MSTRSNARGRRRLSPYLFGRGRAPGPAYEAYIPDETLRARRPLYYIAGVLVIGSLVLQQPLLFVAGLLVAALTALPEVWYRFGLRALAVRHTLSASRAIFGDTVEIALVVENRKLLPLPWLEIADEFPDALPVLGVHLWPGQAERAVLRNTLALWAYQRVRRRYRLRAVMRGAYSFGPMALELSDPFGILSRAQRVSTTTTLLVYPLLVPIERFGLPPRAPFGERASPQRLLEDPLRVAGTRAYVPGDEPRRIHWKATARTGALQSKVYEPSARHTLTILLDVRTFTQVSLGYAPELVELAVSAAASVARWGIAQGYAVGLLSNGTLAAPLGEDRASSGTYRQSTPIGASEDRARGDTEDREERLARAIAKAALAFRLRVPPSSRPEQLTVLLDGLARLYPYYGAPVQQLIASEQYNLPPGSTVVYIGTETVMDVPAIVALRQLRARGHAVTLLLTSPDRPDRTARQREDEYVLHLADLPVHHLGGESAWQSLVADVLGPGTVRRASSPVDVRLTPAARAAALEDVHLEALSADSGVSPDVWQRRSSDGGAERGAPPGQAPGDGSGDGPHGPRALVLD
jgi:uncharacterized protein (DUF58 family)